MQTGLQVKVNRSSYAVVGSTVGELRRVLGTLGPTRDGRTFSAFTDWRIDWAFDLEAGTVVNARVEVFADVLLPRWRPPSSASDRLVEEWQRYLGALETHEDGHVNLAVEAGRSVLGRLETLGGFSGIEELRRVAAENAEAVLLGARDRERAYDGWSRHGALQGGTLLDNVI